MSPQSPLKGWRHWLLDLTPLQDNQAFRILFGVRSLSTILYGILSVAMSWHVFVLTGSSLYVAYIGAFVSVGMLLGLVAGGTLADRYDRRLLMVAGRAMYTLVAFILLANALLVTPLLWLMYLAVFVSGLSAGVSAPALLSVTPTLIARTQLRAAGALNAISIQVGTLVGPLMAGVMIASYGVVACYAFVALTTVAIPLLLLKLPALPPPAAVPVNSWLDIPAGWIEAWRFVRSHQTIRTLFVMDIVLAVFAIPLVLLPQIGTGILRGDAQLVSVLYAAPAMGAMCAALLSGWTKNISSPRACMLGAGTVCGLAMIGLGFADTAVIAIVCLAVFGFAKTVGDIVRMALLQDQTPSAIRGRVSSLWLIQGNASPAIGGMQLGWLSQQWLLGKTLMLSGAVACLAMVCVRRHIGHLPEKTGEDTSPTP